jgi:MFS family permease
LLTLIYSILHMFVDGVCAVAMVGHYIPQENGYFLILIYNFCAFALQMPFGALLDMLCGSLHIKNSREKTVLPFFFAAAGILLTLLGAMTHPAILGIGNALFHVGGGVGTIREDFSHNWKGRALGIFVAPGALGLYLGGLLSRQIGWHMGLSACMGAGVLMILLLFPGVRYLYNPKRITENPAGRPETSSAGIHMNHHISLPCSTAFIFCCLLVVILRSYAGMSISFPWKTTAALSLLSVLAVVLGKMAGGILAAQFKLPVIVVISLLFSAAGLGYSNNAFMGLSGLFFFNMTMPITLYLLVNRFQKLPGFFFGLLTFGLFLGFLPTYLELSLLASGPTLGVIVSLLSLILLMCAAILSHHGRERAPDDC